MATIMILDDDHGGVFQFEDHEAEIVESIGTYELKVQRITGTRGKVAIPYTTEEGTAKAGKDYEHVEGELFFCNEEYEKYIEIPIMEEDSYEKNVVMWKANFSSATRNTKNTLRFPSWRRTATRRMLSCTSLLASPGTLQVPLLERV